MVLLRFEKVLVPTHYQNDQCNHGLVLFGVELLDYILQVVQNEYVRPLVVLRPSSDYSRWAAAQVSVPASAVDHAPTAIATTAHDTRRDRGHQLPGAHHGDTSAVNHYRPAAQRRRRTREAQHPSPTGDHTRSGQPTASGKLPKPLHHTGDIAELAADRHGNIFTGAWGRDIVEAQGRIIRHLLKVARPTLISTAQIHATGWWRSRSGCRRGRRGWLKWSGCRSQTRCAIGHDARPCRVGIQHRIP